VSILLLTGGKLYTPKSEGIKDVLIANGRILSIKSRIPGDMLAFLGEDKVKVVDVKGYMVIPGFVDQHVHINGAGGEGGPQYRTPPIQLSELTRVGITSVVGLLGTDGITRSLRDLLMKARQLEEEGISTWIYTGSYQVPSPTLTGSILSDIMLIDKVIGVKIALSDHRSSHPSVEMLKKIASEARVGGILSGKAGVVHVHMGEEKAGLKPILEAIENTDIPIEQFTPTHLNRSEELLNQAIEFGRAGGYVDVTTCVSPEYGFKKAVKPSEAVRILMKNGVPTERITMSSDGNGSLPIFNDRGELVKIGRAPVSSLYREFKDLVKREGISLEYAVKIVSTNIAKHLKLHTKGELRPGKDADMLVLDEETLEIKYVIAKGEIVVEEGKPVKYGTFENKLGMS